MRVMVMVKATKDSEAGILPTTELLDAMTKFNEALVNAGIMLAGDGLHPSSQGKRVAFRGPKRTVLDGPFAETRELVAGFWLWQVKDMAEAIEWVEALPQSDARPERDRDPPDLRDSRIRRRDDAGDQGTGAADPREDAGAVNTSVDGVGVAGWAARSCGHRVLVTLSK